METQIPHPGGRKECSFVFSPYLWETLVSSVMAVGSASAACSVAGVGDSSNWCYVPLLHFTGFHHANMSLFVSVLVGAARAAADTRNTGNSGGGR